METLNISGITLQGFAQGGIRTSIAIPEVGAIFDCGTVLPTALRYKNIFITHGHPDHIGALQNLIGRREIQDLSPVNVHVPRAIARPLEEIFRLWKEVNGGRRNAYDVNIIPVDVGDRFPLKNNCVAVALKTYHTIDSIGWGIEQTTRRLKSEFVGMDGKDIAKLKQGGTDITDNVTAPLVVIPGDTRIDFLNNETMAQQAKILLHEVTIWTKEGSTVPKTRRFGHTHIDEMVEACSKFQGEALVLVHRSMRHSRKEIEQIALECFPESMRDRIYIFDGGDRGGQSQSPAMPL